MLERQRRHVRLLCQPAFPLALATAAAVLLAWPLLAVPPRLPLVLYAYQFVVWALVIGVLRRLSRALERRCPPEEDGPDG